MVGESGPLHISKERVIEHVWAACQAAVASVLWRLGF